MSSSTSKPTPRALLRGASVALLALGLAGCGTVHQGAAGGSTTAQGPTATSSSPSATASPPTTTTPPPSASPSSPTGPAPSTASPPADAFAQAKQHRFTVLPHAPEGSIAVPWTFWGTADGGRKVVFALASGGCRRILGVTVVETDTSVTIAPRMRTGAAPGQMCPMALVLNAGYVLLDHPLGGRTLLSGATGTASFGPAPQTP